MEKESFHARIKNDVSIKNLYRDIQADLEKVEENLRLFSHSPNQLISEISGYLFQKAGKRIRPALLMLCCRLLGYKGEEHILMSSLVETIHTASLIHDDIIDNSKVRRGKESVHARWGPNITVLLGDYLYIKSIGLSLQSQHRQIINILTDISARMIEGELNEYYMSGNLELEEKDYLDIINKKTASLFSASCRIGAILAHASEDEELRLADFGTNLGMCFQITDDLLDFTGDEKTLGKPILSDIAEGRITLPLIYTLKSDGSANRKRLAELLKARPLEKKACEEILDIVKSNGALDYTFGKAEEFSLRSKESISVFPESVHRRSLILFLDYILTRRK
jgi:octaprenyl-diphosphate synthase